MQNIVEDLKTFIIQENQKLKSELKQELKQELRQDLREDLREDFRNELKTSIDTLRQEMISRFFVLETELGKKIDIIYDYVMLQKEIFGEKFENLRSLEKRTETNEIRVLDHEKRISILERNHS